MTLNLAYKFVALMLMVSEANFFCSQTCLPTTLPVTASDLRKGGHVGPPTLGNFSGSVLTDAYFFGFSQGHLANFRKRGFMPQSSDQAIRERNLELAKFSSLIDTNGAYRLATNWLGGLGLDLGALHAKYRLILHPVAVLSAGPGWDSDRVACLHRGMAGIHPSLPAQARERRSDRHHLRCDEGTGRVSRAGRFALLASSH